MLKKIDHFSLNDLFWIQIKNHLISFGFKALPTGVHFTIGFDSRTTDINLHITKNHSSSQDKPQLKIFIIDKTLLEEITPSLLLSLLNLILKPLEVKNLKTDLDNRINFISFDKFQGSELSSFIEKRLFESFKDISKFRKKTRLKISGNIEQQLEKFVSAEDLQKSIFESLEEFDLSKDFTKNVEGGIILTKDNRINVIRINSKWYTLKNELSFSEILNAFIDPQLARQLIWKTKRAIVQIKNAKNYSDTKDINKPIRLIRLNKNRKAHTANNQ